MAHFVKNKSCSAFLAGTALDKESEYF